MPGPPPLPCARLKPAEAVLLGWKGEKTHGATASEQPVDSRAPSAELQRPRLEKNMRANVRESSERPYSSRPALRRAPQTSPSETDRPASTSERVMRCTPTACISSAGSNGGGATSGPGNGKVCGGARAGAPPRVPLPFWVPFPSSAGHPIGPVGGADPSGPGSGRRGGERERADDACTTRAGRSEVCSRAVRSVLIVSTKETSERETWANFNSKNMCVCGTYMLAIL